LLHSHGDLCYRLHLYFLTFLLSMHRALSLSFHKPHTINIKTIKTKSLSKNQNFHNNFVFKP
jgi:hypothetical protein